MQLGRLACVHVVSGAPPPSCRPLTRGVTGGRCGARAHSSASLARGVASVASRAAHAHLLLNLTISHVCKQGEASVVLHKTRKNRARLAHRGYRGCGDL